MNSWYSLTSYQEVCHQKSVIFGVMKVTWMISLRTVAGQILRSNAPIHSVVTDVMKAVTLLVEDKDGLGKAPKLVSH